MNHQNPHRRPGQPAAGFTLIELMVVILLIGIISAVAFPRLLPVIAFSQLEGNARHLAGYGRGVIAESILMRDPITVRFDLGEQEYHAVHWVIPKEPGEKTEDGEEEIDQLALLNDIRRSGNFAPEDLTGMFSLDQKKQFTGDARDEFDAEKAREQMAYKFNYFAQRVVEEQAKNVHQDEGILEEMDSLFKEKKFDLDAPEPEEEEISEPLLARVRLPRGEVALESVIIAGENKQRGVAEVEITPLGLSSDVWFYLRHLDTGKYYTVVWDSMTGNGKTMRGKQEPE